MTAPLPLPEVPRPAGGMLAFAARTLARARELQNHRATGLQIEPGQRRHRCGTDHNACAVVWPRSGAQSGLLWRRVGQAWLHAARRDQVLSARLWREPPLPPPSSGPVGPS